jgi:hypothetical protein
MRFAPARCAVALKVKMWGGTRRRFDYPDCARRLIARRDAGENLPMIVVVDGFRLRATGVDAVKRTNNIALAGGGSKFRVVRHFTNHVLNCLKRQD